MPTVTGEIRFKGFVLYLFVGAAEIRQEPVLPFLPQGRTMSLLTDPLVEDGRRFLHAVSDRMGEFLSHLAHLSDPGANAVGLRVWEGDLIIAADGSSSFTGTLRRPTGDDYVKMSEIQDYIDRMARDTAYEHARHCKVCAAKLGMDPDLVDDDEEDEVDDIYVSPFWNPTDHGEA